MQTIKLFNDPDYIQRINSQKVLLCLAITYIYCAHYFFVMIAQIKSMHTIKLQMKQLGSRIHIFGILSIICLNYLQSHFLFPLFAWICMILMVIMHGIILSNDVKESSLNNFIALYEFVMMLWFSAAIFLYIYGTYS